MDAADEAPTGIDAEVHHDIDHRTRQAVDLRHRHPATARRLADHQRDLLERQFAAAGVNARHAARVSRGRQAQEVEGFFAAHLRQEDAVRAQAKAGLQQQLRRHRAGPLSALGIEQVQLVRMAGQGQLGRVLDGDEPLGDRDLFDQALHEGGLARAGLAGHHHRLVRLDGQAEELDELAVSFQVQQFALEGLQFAAGLPDPTEQALRCEVFQPAHLHRGLADAHADLVGRRGAGLDDLHALARREGGTEQRVLFVGVLAGQRRDGGGQALAVPERELGDLVALPDAGAFDEDLAGLVHAQLVDAAVIEHAADRLQELGDGGVRPQDGGHGPQDRRGAHRGSSA